MTYIIRKLSSMFPRNLNGNDLKIIAVVAMTLDHIAEGFLPKQFWGYQVLRFIGRITGPTMMFLIAEGYRHTRDIRKYLARLGIFSLISWVPYALFEDGFWPVLDFSVLSTLFLGLLSIYVWERSKWSMPVKAAVIYVLMLLAIPCDWSIFGVVLILIFHIYHDDKKKLLAGYYLVCTFIVGTQIASNGWNSFFQFGLLSVPGLFLWLYSRERGANTPISKWFFYGYYPLHLTILCYFR